MAERIQFSNKEWDFLREILNNIMTDLIHDGESTTMDKKELIKLADKFRLVY